MHAEGSKLLPIAKTIPLHHQEFYLKMQLDFASGELCKKVSLLYHFFTRMSSEQSSGQIMCIDSVCADRAFDPFVDSPSPMGNIMILSG